MQQRKTKAYCIIFLLVFLAFLLLPSVPASAAKKTSKITVKVTKNTDITKALQKKLDLAKKKSNTVYEITIPKGNYKISGSGLKIYSNTHLYMKGVKLTRVKTSGKDSLIMLRSGTVDQKSKGYNGFKNIEIHGGTWDGNGAVGDIMRFAHAQNLLFEGITFTNVKESHHMEIAACKNVVFNKCTFKNFVGILDNDDNHEALQFDIMRQNHFDNFPKYDETPNSHITVKNCTFKNLQRGIGSHSAIIGSYFSNMVFKNNKFENITGYAITAINYKNSKINNNKITNCGSGILFRTISKANATFYTPKSGKYTISKNLKSEISGNTISTKNKGYPNMIVGISLYGENLTAKSGSIPKGDYRLRGVSVKNNTIKQSAKGIALLLEGTLDSTITNNKITCNITKEGNGSGDGDAIRLEKSCNNTIEKNKITNKTKTGKASEMRGITVIKSSDGNIVKSNKITGTSKDGIRVNGSKNVKVTSNEITNTGSDGLGIIFTEKANDGIVKGNTITNTNSDGIRISKSTGAIVKENTISNSKKGIGIVLTNQSTKGSVSSNTVKSSASDGIRINASTDVKVNDNILSSNSGTGIVLMTGSNNGTVSSNKVKTSGNDGIRINGSTKAKVKLNTVTDSKAIGISALGKSNGTLISSNKVKTSGSDGIRINGSTNVTAELNEVTENKGIGISILNQSNGAEISSNKITKTIGQDSIRVNASTDIKVISNTVDGNSRYGLYVYGGGSAYIYDNNTFKNYGVKDMKAAEDSVISTEN